MASYGDWRGGCMVWVCAWVISTVFQFSLKNTQAIRRRTKPNWPLCTGLPFLPTDFKHALERSRGRMESLTIPTLLS